jgi:UDP-3-O-[3-hydroxymyristoyl] glucosamine N-acyltransferase, LpxD
LPSVSDPRKGTTVSNWTQFNSFRASKLKPLKLDQIRRHGGVNHPTRVGNPRFFTCTGPHSLAAIAAAAGCQPPHQDRLVSGLAALPLAEPDEISFVAGRRHTAALSLTRAGAVLVSADMLADVPPGTVPMITSDPMASWGLIAALFHPMPCVNPGVHPYPQS